MKAKHFIGISLTLSFFGCQVGKGPPNTYSFSQNTVEAKTQAVKILTDVDQTKKLILIDDQQSILVHQNGESLNLIKNSSEGFDAYWASQDGKANISLILNENGTPERAMVNNEVEASFKNYNFKENTVEIHLKNLKTNALSVVLRQMPPHLSSRANENFAVKFISVEDGIDWALWGVSGLQCALGTAATLGSVVYTGPGATVLVPAIGTPTAAVCGAFTFDTGVKVYKAFNPDDKGVRIVDATVNTGRCGYAPADIATEVFSGNKGKIALSLVGAASDCASVFENANELKEINDREKAQAEKAIAEQKAEYERQKQLADQKLRENQQSNTNTNTNTNVNPNSSTNTNTNVNPNSSTNTNTNVNPNSSTNTNTNVNPNSSTNTNTVSNSNSLSIDNIPGFSTPGLPNVTTIGRKINFSGFAYDDKGLTKVTMYVSGPRGQDKFVFTRDLDSVKSLDLSEFYFDPDNEDYARMSGNYKVALWVKDTNQQTNSYLFDVTVGNANSQPVPSQPVSIDNPPGFSTPSLPKSTTIGRKINFSGLAYDDKGLTKVTMYVSGPRGQDKFVFTRDLDSVKSLDLSEFYFDPDNEDYARMSGSYKVALWVKDTNQQTNSYLFDVTVGNANVQSTATDTPPAFSNPGLLNTTTIGRKINFSGLAYDDKGLIKVTMYVSGPRGQDKFVFTRDLDSVKSLDLSQFYFDPDNEDYARMSGSYRVALWIKDTAQQTNSYLFDVVVK